MKDYKYYKRNCLHFPSPKVKNKTSITVTLVRHIEEDTNTKPVLDPLTASALL